MKKLKKSKKKIIGRRELVDFPELGFFGIEAKIDTGAYTSSVHCKNVEEYEKDGVPFVSFVLLDPGHSDIGDSSFHWKLHDKTMVKNSFGQTEERYVIMTKIRLFEEEYDVELSLADRSAMDYPVLLGRKVLKRRFLVDVSKINCSTKIKQK